MHRVVSFTSQWHRSCWRLSDLPTLLGACVIDQPGPSWVLGASCDLGGGERIIALNEWLHDSPLRNVILAHEAAHLILQNTSPTWCDVRAQRPRGEAQAWLGAALLMIPAEATRDAFDCDDRIGQIASDYGVPLPIADLAVTAHASMRDPDLRWSGQVGDALISINHMVHTASRRQAHPD